VGFSRIRGGGRKGGFFFSPGVNHIGAVFLDFPHNQQRGGGGARSPEKNQHKRFLSTFLYTHFLPGGAPRHLARGPFQGCPGGGIQ